MTLPSGNLFAQLPPLEPSQPEWFQTLLSGQGWQLERILSAGHRSEAGFWYDQPQGEFVLLLQGEARLRIEQEAEARTLGPGDWLYLPAGCRHRVEWTSPTQPTLWLALHLAPEAALPVTPNNIE
ncbi:cupin domain-containing protein [Ferrimonas balearica]|uniref:cupin domain-containing protein n=1 Tax=Ferrimonas balearica TaxID=44012 RepID=UPI001C98EAFB|nr:cupin domain-containing protein [Ferrimonas balearica]MBY5993912.1 cupin domain-containing protein [Ferrimonas balearica]